MKKGEIVQKLSEDSGVSKKDVDLVLSALPALLVSALNEGGSLLLPSVGTFKKGERAARTGRNPQTGEAIQIAAAKTVTFKASKPLKDACN